MNSSSESLKQSLEEIQSIQNIVGQSQNSSDTLGAIITAFLGLFFVAFIICLLFYFFYSFGLMKIAKRNQVKYSWLSWIPFANSYIVGQIAFNKDTTKSILFLLVNLVYPTLVSVYSYQTLQSPATAFPQYLYSMLSFISLIITFIAMYKIYKKMSDKAVVMTVFSVLSCNLLTPIFLFAIRNNSVRELSLQN